MSTLEFDSFPVKLSHGADDRHPPLKADWQQYVVGYRSLVEAESKQMTELNSGASRPVLVTGFRREWKLHGTFPTTFLGVWIDRAPGGVLN